jgi:hypothetical protein
MVVQIPKLLAGLFSHCPAFIPAAVNGNITPGLVRVLRTFCAGGQFRAEELDDTTFSLFCLSLMDESDKNSIIFWKPAIHAGIVPVLTHLLTSGHEATIFGVLRLSGSLLLASLPEEPRPGAGTLPRAIAGLLSASPPVAVYEAAETLLNIGQMRPDLIEDSHAWGMADSLQRLKLHGDPRTAAAATRLMSIVGNMADVSLRLSSQCLLVFLLCCRGVCYVKLYMMQVPGRAFIAALFPHVTALGLVISYIHSRHRELTLGDFESTSSSDVLKGTYRS